MKLSALFIGLLAMAVLVPATLFADADDEALDLLKERFKKRYPVLLALKDAGKVGEVHDGFAAAVKESHLGEMAEPGKEDSKTVRDFLAEENGDRQTLYQILAKRAGPEISAAVYAERAGLRNFERAAPDHWLKPKDKDWVQKKDLEE